MTTNYVGDGSARTNEINLKGYEPALAVRPVACISYGSPPIGGISQSGEPFAVDSKRSRARIISIHNA
jgi:hypothetical protein